MRRSRRRGLWFGLVLAVGTPALGADQAEVVRRATRLLEEIASDPECGIPARSIREAQGIVVVPHFVETQLGVGWKKGRGVLMTRAEGGGWGDPRLVEISKFSVGPELGREVGDVVILCRTPKGVRDSSMQVLSFEASYRYFASIRPPRKFSGPKLADGATPRDSEIYTRHRGVVLGAKVAGQLKTLSPDPPRIELPSPTVPGKPAPPAPLAALKVEEVASPEALERAKELAESPESARLKAVVAAMTAPPVVAAGDKAPRDPGLSPASATRPLPGTLDRPR